MCDDSGHCGILGFLEGEKFLSQVIGSLSEVVETLKTRPLEAAIAILFISTLLFIREIRKILHLIYKISPKKSRNRKLKSRVATLERHIKAARRLRRTLE